MLDTCRESGLGMAWYRMYLVDKFGKFRWPHDLNADSDSEALALVHAMQHACSDMAVSMELWQGARRIPGVSGKTPSILRETWEEMLAKRQDALLRTEEAFCNSGTAVARSRRLRERIEDTKRAIRTRAEISA
jgi:hypothetical protein